MANCMYCRREIPAQSEFCMHCGQKQVIKYTQVFQRGKMKEDEFINQINMWFAQYPTVANVKASFKLHDAVGLMVNKKVLDSVAIEYEVFKSPNQNQYAIVNLEKFGFHNTSEEAMLARWQESNPGAKIISKGGGAWMRGESGSLMLNGLGASNRRQIYILFKFDRNLGPAVPPPQV